VAALPWNQWQLSRGMGGRLRLESVATLVWNTQTLVCGVLKRSAAPPIKSLVMSFLYTETVLLRGESASPYVAFELSKNFLDLCTKIHVSLGKLGSVV